MTDAGPGLTEAGYKRTLVALPPSQPAVMAFNNRKQPMAEFAGVVTSIFVGLPRELGTAGADDPMDKPWYSGFIKAPVSGPVLLGKINLDGDGQGDLAHHGGVNKAVCCYPASHYEEWWREQLNMSELTRGSFGENFAVDGATEDDVCIGDVWRVGEAVVQVSQPRGPCWKLARRWRVKDLALQVQQTGRTGWYLRVLTEGIVAPNSPIALVERPNPEWTIARANQIMNHDKHDLAASAALAAVPELSSNWRETLTNRVERGVERDSARRLEGRGLDPMAGAPGASD